MLGTPEPLLQMLIDGDISAEFDLKVNAEALVRWLDRYADIDPGLADACVVRMAEITPRSEVLTTDRRDFSIYRTLSGRAVKCVLPPMR